MNRLPAPLPYVDARELATTPHVVVDGTALESTVLCLSHWPATPTPRRLWRDVSAEIALAYLGHPRYSRHGGVAVTNDHLDEDGLCALYVLVDPAAARRVAPLLVEVARAGDFLVVTSARARTIALALRALFDPVRSPLAEQRGDAEEHDPMGWAAQCYREGIARLPELFEHPERFATWAADESDAVARSGAFLDRSCRLDDDEQLDLAIVTSPDEADLAPVELGHGVVLPLHPMALHHRTPRARVLVALGSQIAYYDRYETWVRYTSERHVLRRDLAPLASALTAIEPGGLVWQADSPGALVPVLRPAGGRSELGTARVLSALREHLRRAPAAWDPFAPTLAAVRVSGPAAPRGETTGRGPFRSRGPRPTAR